MVLVARLNEQASTTPSCYMGGSHVDVDRTVQRGAEVLTKHEDLFGIAVGVEGDAVLLVASGELDVAAQDEFTASAEALLPLMADVIVDLSDVSFMDSSGLHALLHLRVSAVAAGGSLVVRSPSPQVQRLLELTRTEEMLGYHPR
jgi:anti-anti-sigma factor